MSVFVRRKLPSVSRLHLLLTVASGPSGPWGSGVSRHPPVPRPCTPHSAGQSIIKEIYNLGKESLLLPLHAALINKWYITCNVVGLCKKAEECVSLHLSNDG